MSALFGGEAKGEILQLRDQLDGNDAKERKAAAKRCIAIMRAGENVSSLFSSMLRCVKTPDVELKKMAYLYLVTYSSQEPEQAIMAVNTFIQDSQDPSPVVRALAVRTMCRIRLQSVAEYMVIPLRKTLHDGDAYVRKTAAFGVSKLFDVIPESVENAGLLDDLLKLLGDANPMVIANAITAILEINENRSTPIFTLSAKTVTPILNATMECTEWCQTLLYDALSRYTPGKAEDADFLIERMMPFLKHKNPAVVVGSFRCIFNWMPASGKQPQELFPQIIVPFVTLVTAADVEIQYVVLRTLSLFVQKYPRLLAKQVRIFFCKYNDPSYIKMEKLDVIVAVCDAQIAQLVLDEMSEYANHVDVAFVRKAIACVGQIAVRIEAAARRCVDILVGLVGGKASYAVEEAIVVVCDILRKFPGTFESILATVCQNLEHVKEPRARAAAIWILGEYCDMIEHVDVLLDPYLDTFHDEQVQVQLQILCALVKLYIEKPDETRDQLQFILNEATKDRNVPDVRNRALIYWRILSADPHVAKDIVVFGKQTVMHSGLHFDANILDEMIRNMGTVSGVLHVIPADFVKRVRFFPEDSDDDMRVESGLRVWRQLHVNDDSILDLFVDYDKGHMHLRIVNKSAAPVGRFEFAVNTNSVGMIVTGAPDFPASLEDGDVAEIVMSVAFEPLQIANPERTDLQMALRTSAGDVFALGKIPVEWAMTPDGNIGADAFRDLFSSLTDVAMVTLPDAKLSSDEQLAERNIFVVGRNESKVYCSFQLPSKSVFVAELEQQGLNIIATIRAQDPVYLPLVQQNVQSLFSQSK